MNKQSIIGILLIVAILVVYGIITQPSKEEVEKKQRVQDSIAKVQKKIDDSVNAAKVVPVKKDTAVKAAVKGDTSKVSDSAMKADQKNELGSFAYVAEGKNKMITVENEMFRIKFSTLGGRIYSVMLKNYKTFDQKPLYLFNGDSTTFSLNFFSNNRSINTGSLYFKPMLAGGKALTSDSMSVKGKDSLTLVMSLVADSATSGKSIDFIYTLRGNKYDMGFSIGFNGMKNIIMANSGYVDLMWKIQMPRIEKSISNEHANSTVYYKSFSDEEVDYLSESSEDKLSIKTKVKWMAFKQQFFSSILSAPAGFANADVEVKVTDTMHNHLKKAEAKMGVPFNAQTNNESFAMNFYFGPNHYKTMRQYHDDYERVIPLGWSFFLMRWFNQYITIPVFNFLETNTAFNYGIIILILTILLKILLFPIARKTYMSSAKMRVLKPDVEEIGKKFPKKEDAMKKQQATMALYKKAGVNPMAGCIPMLLQFPILIAMFRFFPASFELRQQSFLWAEDLSSYDSILSLGFNIPFYGDHVSLFTLLMTISTIIYTRTNMDMMSTGTQMPGMKVMMYIMPVMFLGIFNNYASGLSYYYFLANMLTFAQQYAFRRFVNHDKVMEKINANKAKNVTVKKSKFQLRLEEMAKQRGYQPKKK
ncbi:MAG: membrane protein insertase YidC [Bacteroidota bacterium]